MIETPTLWLVIAAVGLGSFALRFFFLGVIGDKPLPKWLLRHLRYTAVAVLPALVAPVVLWPPATGGMTDATRLAAAVATVLVGYFSRNMLAAITIGAGVLFLGTTFLG